jgi:hypothetical protein
VPRSQDDGVSSRGGDELVAEIIPLRRRTRVGEAPPERPRVHEHQPATPAHNGHLAPADRSVWDGPTMELPRRRARERRRPAGEPGHWRLRSPRLASRSALPVALLCILAGSAALAVGHGGARPGKPVASPSAASTSLVSSVPARVSSAVSPSDGSHGRLTSAGTSSRRRGARSSRAAHGNAGPRPPGRERAGVTIEASSEGPSHAAPASVQPNTGQQPGGFSYLGVPAGGGAPASTPQSARAANTTSAGGPFSP